MYTIPGDGEEEEDLFFSLFLRFGLGWEVEGPACGDGDTERSASTSASISTSTSVDGSLGRLEEGMGEAMVENVLEQ